MRKADEAQFMKGMLSFVILWLLSKKSMNGQQIAGEIAKRKGSAPSSGTLYPAFNRLEKMKLVKGTRKGRSVVYVLTSKGRKGIKKSMEYFCKAFDEIFKDYSKNQ